jgi:hypothetical protein
LIVYVISLVGLCAADAQEADKKTPCEHLVQYMQAARKITGEFAASERAHRLLALKRSYTKKIKHAPEDARIAARQWIAELSRAEHRIKSGEMEDAAVFDVLRFRNRAVSACEMSAAEAGF